MQRPDLVTENLVKLEFDSLCVVIALYEFFVLRPQSVKPSHRIYFELAVRTREHFLVGNAEFRQPSIEFPQKLHDQELEALRRKLQPALVPGSS